MSDEILDEARERFRDSQDGSDYNRQAAEDDISFSRLSDQWPQDIQRIRREEGRPCLTINRLPAYIRSVVNESRQNKPAIKVTGRDSGSDPDTAQVISGLIKSIEHNSNAEIAYDTAIDHAVTGGFGFFRINIDYAHSDSFNLEARINRIPNPLQVHWDVTSTEFDASDWNYAFVSEMLSEKEFKKLYPKANTVDFEADARAQTSEFWLEENQIRVAEYWSREEKKRTLLKLSDGMVIREEQIEKMARGFIENLGQDVGGASASELIRLFMETRGVEEIGRREASYHDVKRRILNGQEVLSEEDWPGSTIPICPVWGEEVYSDGRRYFRSLIRDAKDPQQMLNFWRSASTELVALAPKAPWLIEEGGVPKGKELAWKTANTRSHPYLEYTKGSNVPQRQPFSGVPGGALQEALNSAQDMQDITGIYPSAIGARSNETSGRAIMARERQGDVSNFHFIDNLSRAIRYAGRVLVDIIPAVYSPQSTIRILGEDSKDKVVQLTQEDGGSKQPGINEEDRLYNISVGHYDVSVATGPSFSTQREEARETLTEIMRNVPSSAPYIGDVLMEHLDFVGSDRVAKRLKSLLPEEVRRNEENLGQSKLPPEAQQALMQKDQQLQQQTMQMQEMQKALQEKQNMAQAEQQAAAAKQAEIQIKQAEAEAKAQLDQQKLNLEQQKLELEKMKIMEASRQKELDRDAEMQRTLIKEDEPTVVDEIIDDIEDSMNNANGVISVERTVTEEIPTA